MSDFTKYQAALAATINGFEGDNDSALWDLLSADPDDALANAVIRVFWDIQSAENDYTNALRQMRNAADRELEKVAEGLSTSDWFSSYSRNATEARLTLEGKTREFKTLVYILNHR